MTVLQKDIVSDSNLWPFVFRVFFHFLWVYGHAQGASSQGRALRSGGLW